MNKTLSNFLVGFLAGAAVGAVAGILFAPDKGSKTRQNLGKKMKDIDEEFGLGISDFLDDMGLETEPPVPRRKKRPTSNRPARPTSKD